MGRQGKIVVSVAAMIIGLFALHVQLNLGGWPRFVGRMRTGNQVRGELLVGYLPVT
jgi:hypothetical protein